MSKTKDTRQVESPAYQSDRQPDFSSFEIKPSAMPAYQYKKTLKDELKTGAVTKAEAVNMLEDMLTIRELEDMLVRLRSGAYEPLLSFNYRGPTHVSIGQEGASVGACSALRLQDNITSTHRGHGDSLAKGMVAIRQMSEEQLRERLPEPKTDNYEDLLAEAMDDHIFRTIAELFGKEDGYCKGRGGGMHIADFRIGHLGANAIVGGGVPIAAGAAMAERYKGNDKVVCCFAGDGAYANGVVLESLNWASQAQWTNHLAQARKYGLPIVFVIENNHYGMTGRADDEVMGVAKLVRRGAGFADNNMHAEVVNGMDVLAVRDSLNRAGDICREGNGPVLLEVDTYRYYGHSLSDPRKEYRTKGEEESWKELDAIETYKKQLLDAGVLDDEGIQELEKKVADRNARMAVEASESADPAAEDVLKYMYTDTVADTVPEDNQKVEIIEDPPATERDDEGLMLYRDAVKEAFVEEMKRDNRVIFYGEDVADYGNAFKVTKGLLETFGRDRVFNSPISEACICGTAVGASMVGLRPVVELMYMDFALMASDQISNQAAKWHYMSGAQTEVPLVVRASVGGGKGYGGQHSQTLESIFAHIPGMYVIYPATPYDAKGLLKSAIRDNNPIMFVESQLLYSSKGEVPEEEYTLPIGVADIKRRGDDVTLVAWGPAVLDTVKAADRMAKEENISAEVIDIRSLIPLDMDTILRSLEKTGRCVVISQAVDVGSYTGNIAARIMESGFDYLDAPVLRVGAKNGIAPQSHILEAEFMPDEDDIITTAKELF